MCALDCPDTCSILVEIDDSGRATKLKGNRDHPITRGFLCAKVTKYLEREYHPERLLYPLRRTGPKGQPFLPFAYGQFQTPSGKFEFGAESLDYLPPVESRSGDSGVSQRFPLELVSGKNDDSMNSMFGLLGRGDASRLN